MVNDKGEPDCKPDATSKADDNNNTTCLFTDLPTMNNINNQRE
jgi:hypothetical protein